jgi:hypothetical protein
MINSKKSNMIRNVSFVILASLLFIGVPIASIFSPPEKEEKQEIMFTRGGNRIIIHREPTIKELQKQFDEVKWMIFCTQNKIEELKKSGKL